MSVRQISLHHHPASAGRNGLLSRLIDWNQHRVQMHALRRLDDHQLRDIGLTRAAVRRMSPEPHWDAPDHWSWGA
jgi:uncharacterized protein YjiS (DUF1127 family)